MDYRYKTSGVCSREILFSVEDGKVKDIKFIGGCNGNLQGISLLANGMDVDELIEKLSGVKCGFKNTSCPDQFAKALLAAKENQTSNK